ncbi:MAG: molybdopterin-dependent oxidoreductase [Pirellulaceae bacterium]
MFRNKAGVFKAVSWEQALHEFTSRFKSIQQQFGPASVAFLSTGQIASEEMAMLGASLNSVWESCMEMEIRGNAWQLR